MTREDDERDKAPSGAGKGRERDRGDTLATLRGVGLVFPDGTRALDDVSLEVYEGETLALVGESGSGKTTLLQLLNRLREPTEGEILLGGEPASEIDATALRRRTGYVPQNGGLLPHWVVGRNVALVPELLGWESTKRRERVDELLELVGLEPDTYRERYPHELSGGQRQRVALARALAADPPLVLLDEPFGALDALTRRELQSEFARLEERLAKSMVLVTHDLGEARRLAHRVAVLKEGRLRQVAAFDELVEDPADDYVRELVALTTEEPA